MADHERVLRAGFAVDQHFGFAVERAVEIVDAIAVQDDATQRDQQARPWREARIATAQPPVHRHRLRAVFGQMHRMHAIIVCSLTTLLVFLLLGLSTIPVLRAIGLPVAIGVASNFVLALLIVRHDSVERTA